MIIEFVGIQGAGKSTLARELSTLSDLPCHVGLKPRQGNMYRRWLSRLGDFAAVPDLALRCVPGITSPRTAILFARLCRYERYMRALKRDKGIHILEEGPIHGIARLGTNDLRNFDLIHRVSVPYLIVHVTVEPELAYKRILERSGQIDIDKMPKGQAIKQLRSRTTIITQLLRNTPGKTITIDGEATPQSNAALLSSMLD